MIYASIVNMICLLCCLLVNTWHVGYMDSKSTAKRFHNNSCIFHIMIHSRNVFITLDANLSVENALILCHNTCFVGVS